jgi:hypothetical protein
MNLELLGYLLNDGVHHIEELVNITKYDLTPATGVGAILLANEGDIEKLSPKQKFYYEKFIKPLIENVPCEGIYGPGTCTGTDFVDDESLLISYQEENFLCQHCRYDQGQHEAE